MSRTNIAEVGKRFSSEYQPAKRGRPKGSLNSRTILRLYLEQQDPPTAQEVIDQILNAAFGKRRARRIRRRMKPTRI
ncbi:MAG TPA: hypothetical protein VE135_25870 [Pyrinomonadaceae bacterium]|nr:hypothetical protein [Pyrinomonadaceae bacterium]